MEPKERSNSTIFLIIGAGFALFFFGCILVFTVGAIAFRNSSAESVEISGVQRPLPVTPPTPITIIARPEGGLDYESAVFSNIYSAVNPSVVNIRILGQSSTLLPEGELPRGVDPEDYFAFTSGSGFVWDSEGHIVTNNHVVADADQVQVIFSDGRTAVAEVVGADLDSDLAVLVIDPDGYELSPVRLGDLNSVFVGMRVAAIGNPFGLQGTLTTGIVSALGRSIPARANYSIPDSIQTDAPINPGNSGGPLLNEQGEVIGVNAQIRSEDRANSGIGFAIPISIVKRVVPVLIEEGKYTHPYIGISGQTFSPICADELDLPKELRGAMVMNVLSRTPADRAGLRAGDQALNSTYPGLCPDRSGGDVITAIEDQSVSTFDDILIYLQRHTSPGDTVTLTLVREGESIELDLTLVARPD